MGPEKVKYMDKVEYRLNGDLHREDGPAVIFKDGTKWWFKNGVRHREGGPAVTFKNGHKSWLINGKRHREDGPAIIEGDGIEKWPVDGLFLKDAEVETAKQIFSGKYPFEDLPLLINHPTLKYFALNALKGNNIT